MCKEIVTLFPKFHGFHVSLAQVSARFPRRSSRRALPNTNRRPTPLRQEPPSCPNPTLTPNHIRPYITIDDHLCRARQSRNNNAVHLLWRNVYAKVHGRLIADGFPANTSLSNGLIIFYSKNGELGNARQVFDRMPERSVVAWTALISKYCPHADCEEALRVFSARRMVKPNQFTYGSALSACTRLCCLDSGMQIQDDENALLQQALAMSMDDPSSSVAVRDTDMSEASADDHDLQLDHGMRPLTKITKQ